MSDISVTVTSPGTPSVSAGKGDTYTATVGNGGSVDVTYGAQAVTIPQASANQLGGIKIGSGLTIDANTGVVTAAAATYTAGTGIQITNGTITCTVSATTSASDLTTGTLSASLLANSGVTAGTYTSVTVDSKGRVTAGGTHSVAAADVSGLGSLATVSPTGSATSSTFLRGDSVWATPPGTTYTAGTGIKIDGSTISCTVSSGGSYTAGSGIAINGSTISANVVSVAGRTGAVALTTADVSGLGSLATQSSVAYSSLTGTPSTFAPSAHAASHGSAGSDPITIASTQVTGLGSLATVSPTGTASSSTWLRGDGSWQSITQGIGGTLEYANTAAFPATGVAGRLYIAADKSRLYRWTGDAVYAEVGSVQGATLAVVQTPAPIVAALIAG